MHDCEYCGDDEDGNPKEEPDCVGCDDPECPEYGNSYHSDHEPGTIPAAALIAAGTGFDEEPPF